MEDVKCQNSLHNTIVASNLTCCLHVRGGHSRPYIVQWVVIIGLGHETVVCAACLSIFLWICDMAGFLHGTFVSLLVFALNLVPFWCRNLAIKKTIRTPPPPPRPLWNKSHHQFSSAAMCFMPKIVSYQTTPVWFVKNEYLMVKIDV